MKKQGELRVPSVNEVEKPGPRIAKDRTDKKGSAAIKLDNAFINKIFESLPYPFYVIDANNFTIELANAATSVFGNLHTGVTCYTLTHNRNSPCDDPEHLCPLEEVKKYKKPVVTEHFHYDADGNKSIYEVHAYPVVDATGKVAQMIEFSLNITERKRTENALKESERKYHKLAQASFEGIVLHENGIILEVNDAMEGILGFRASELVGKEIFDFVCSEQRGIVSEYMLSDCATPFEAVLTKKEGIRVIVELRSNSFSYQGRDVRVTTVRDITDRKEMEEELRAQKDVLLKTFEQAPIGIAILHQDGNFFFWNSTLERMTGYFRREFRHMVFENLVDRHEVENFRKKFRQRAERTWKSYKFPTTIIRRNGELLDIELYTYRIYDTTKEIPLYVCFVRDVTETKLKEIKQKSLIHKLQQLHTELNEFSEMLAESKTEEQKISGEADYGMSKRDNQIISWACQGYRNREIAEQLGIAEITVKKHLSNIYREIGVTRRLELIERFRDIPKAGMSIRF